MVFQLMKKHFVQNKAIFSLFVICQIFSLLVLLFIFNLLHMRDAISVYNQSKYRTVSVTFSETDGEKMTAMQNALNDAELIDKLERIEGLAAFEGRGIEILFYRGEEAKEVIDAGRNIAPNEVASRASVAVVQFSVTQTADTVKVGDPITLFGNTYEVVGLVSGTARTQIPFDGKSDVMISKVSFVHEDGLHVTERAALVEKLKAAFPTASVSEPPAMPVEEFEISAEFILILLALIIVNINFATMYYYILDRDKRTYSIFKMCGCSSLRGLWILLKELCIVCLAAFFISLLLFEAVGGTVFSFMNAAIIYRFSWQTTLYALLAYTIGMAVIFVPTAISYNKRSAYDVYRKEDGE